MRSFAILIFAMVVLFQSLLAVPSTLSVRTDQNVGEQSKEMLNIQQKIMGYGFPWNTLQSYTIGLGLPWGQCLNSDWVLGCNQVSYQARCWPNNCGYYPGGYTAAWSSMTSLYPSLIGLRNQVLKAQVDHKEDKNQA